MDSKSFCEALGPKVANQQLRRHWKTWVTEEIIAELSFLGDTSTFKPQN
jgi:glucan 1,3-beta-glucosidase